MLNTPKETNIISQAVAKTGSAPEGTIPLYDFDINVDSVKQTMGANSNVPLVGWLQLKQFPAISGLIGLRAINGGDVLLIRQRGNRELVSPGHSYVLISKALSVVEYSQHGSTAAKWTFRIHNTSCKNLRITISPVK